MRQPVAPHSRLARLAMLAAGLILAGCSAEPVPPPDNDGAESTAENGQNDAPPASIDDIVQVRTLASVPSIEPGETFDLAVVMTLAEHWHTYWIDAGASGAPTEFSVAAPPGFTVGEAKYPRPQVFSDPNGDTFGYEHEVLFFIPITAPATLDDNPAEFTITTYYFACKKMCLMGDATRTVTLPVSDPTAEALSDDDQALLNTFRARLPKSLSELADVQWTLESHQLSITGLQTHDPVVFIPRATPGVTFGDPHILPGDEMFHAAIPYQVDPDNALGQPLAIRGLLCLGESLDDPCYDVHIPVTSEESEPES
jgi:DsbC/DsbD-like thiol-disulfide interchange protein